jgi:hypothetical protein
MNKQLLILILVNDVWAYMISREWPLYDVFQVNNAL